MKRFAFLFALLSSSAGISLGQTNQTDILKDLSAVPAERFERHIQFKSNILNQVSGPNIQYRGVLPAMKKADNPLQLINPFAPAKYGNGFDNVAVDPLGRRAEGVMLFAISF